jgi:hypothetical protein
VDDAWKAKIPKGARVTRAKDGRAGEVVGRYFGPGGTWYRIKWDGVLEEHSSEPETDLKEQG